MGKTKIYIICNNDSPEYAVINDIKRAEEIKQKFESESKSNNNKWNVNYWHIHEVEGE